jgi:hypothetical protein
VASRYVRKGMIWCRLKDERGRWISKSTGCHVGQDADADEYIAAAQARLDAKRALAPNGPLTVARFVERWLEARRKETSDWRNDESRLRLHVLPIIGGLELARVRAPAIVDLIRRVRASSKRPVSPRTVYNIYSVVSALFRDAKLAGLIDESPCCLDDRQLGPRVDSADFDRAEAVFSRAEAVEIISTPRIPLDRSVVYALELLAGIRTGETAALRWRRYDPTAQPLGRLSVAKSYNTRANREKGTKTEAVRHVPVHPTLAAILAEWKLSGWAAMMGRAPGPDDLIVPLPPEHAARRRSRDGEPFRGHDYSGKRWREADLPALGRRHRQHYDMRATFITLALEDGADPEVIESRVTHTKRSRSAFRGYDRGERWAQTCAEVAKLRIVREPRGEVAVLQASTETPADLATPLLHPDDPRRESEWRRRESNPTLRSPVTTGAPGKSPGYGLRVVTDDHAWPGGVATDVTPADIAEIVRLLMAGDVIGAKRIAVQLWASGVGREESQPTNRRSTR